LVEQKQQPHSVRIAKVGVFAALFVVTSYIPISLFIGTPSFLALSIIITPIIAILLSPLDAFCASFIGGLLSFYIIPSQAAFGPFSILLPVCGATLGSIAYHNKKIGFLTALFLLIAVFSYLFVNFPFPYFVVPHVLAIILTPFSLLSRFSDRIRVPIFVFIATMSEQGLMMIFSVYLLALPWQAFIGILPLMIYERLISFFGASLISLGLKRLLPSYFTKNGGGFN